MEHDANGKPVEHVYEWMDNHANRFKPVLRNEDNKHSANDEVSYLALKQQYMPNAVVKRGLFESPAADSADENFKSRVLSSSFIG